MSQRGRGPKGYQRSDERIQEDLSERIMEQGLDASEVEVRVSGGEVTLTGTVRDRSLRFQLEHLADQISGVTDVTNNIRVAREGGSGGSSSERSGSNAGSSSGSEKSSEAGAAGGESRSRPSSSTTKS